MLIIQPTLPSYRLPFFCCLAERLNEKITILHFGEQTGLSHPLVTEQVGGFFEYKGLKYVRGLNRLSSNHATIVTVFDPHWMNLFTLPFFSKGRKIILWGHGVGNNSLVNRLRVPFINKATSFIVYSEKGRNRLFDLGLKNESIYVVNNTLKVSNSQDTSCFSRNNFLFVGRLQRRKKLDVFFRIFRELELGRLGYTITLVGSGIEEKLFLKNYADNLGISEYISFRDGTTSDAELLKYFAVAKYYISPGAVGLGVLHSFAYGVPVLTMQDENHGPEIDNIHDGINGHVFFDEIDFKNKLVSIVSSDVAELLGRNSFSYYRNIDAMVSEFIQALGDSGSVYE